FCFSPKRWREVDEIIVYETVVIVRKYVSMCVERERLRRGVPLAGHVALFDRAFFDRPDRLASDSIERIHHRLFGRLHERFDRSSVDGDVRKNWRARDVVIPDAVMLQLKVPLALPGLQIDGDNALAKEVAPGPMAAVIVAGRQLDREIRYSQFFVDR